MEQSLITGFLAVSVALLNPSSASHITTTSEQSQQMWDYHVLEGDSLESIAEKVYGSSEYWTTLMNDNGFIQNPDLIEKGMVLKIKIVQPTAPDILKEESNDQAVENKFVATNITSTIDTEVNSEPEAKTVEITPQVTNPAPVQTQTVNSLNEAQINFLGNCESGMTATRNSGNGYYGAFQFSYGTWKSMGTAYERADLAPLEVQIDAVQRLVARSSIFTQFPACSRKMQAMGII